MSTKKNHLLTPREVATILNTNQTHLKYWRDKNLGPKFVEIEAEVKYNMKDVRKYIEDKKDESIESYESAMARLQIEESKNDG